MRINLLSGWFTAIIVALACGLAAELLFGVRYPVAHMAASLLVKLAVPGFFLSHIASEFFPPQRARGVQWLVNAGVAFLLSTVMAASIVPILSVPFIHNIRIWGDLLLQLGITLGIVALGSTMAMNYLRVPSGRMRGIVLFVMIALAASMVWVSWDVAAILAVLLLAVRLTAK